MPMSRQYGRGLLSCLKTLTMQAASLLHLHLWWKLCQQGPGQLSFLLI